MSHFDAEYDEYMADIRKFNSQVESGRRVASEDPRNPKFSQEADDERQAKARGLGNRIDLGPTRETLNIAMQEQHDRMFAATDIRQYEGLTKYGVPSPEQEALVEKAGPAALIGGIGGLLKAGAIKVGSGLMAGLPIGAGGEGNKSAVDQMKVLEQEERDLAAHTKRPQLGPGVGPEFGTGAKMVPLYTPDEIRKRIPKARVKEGAVDMFEGMDAELRKAMELEDKAEAQRKKQFKR
jgi:hypothetical protein